MHAIQLEQFYIVGIIFGLYNTLLFQNSKNNYANKHCLKLSFELFPAIRGKSSEKVSIIESVILHIFFTLKLWEKVLFSIFLQHNFLSSSDWNNIKLWLAQNIIQTSRLLSKNQQCPNILIYCSIIILRKWLPVLIQNHKFTYHFWFVEKIYHACET